MDIKVKFVAYKLKGKASIWWDTLREMRMREGVIQFKHGV